MEHTLEIILREVYGKITAYPVNEQARKLAAMMGTKTLTPGACRDAMGMGFKFIRRDSYGDPLPTTLSVYIGI